MTDLATNAMNSLIAAVLLSAVLLMAIGRMRTLVSLFALQSLSLGLLAAVVGYNTGFWHMFLVAIITIGLKALLIPSILNSVMERIGVVKEVEPSIRAPSSLLISAGMVILGYYVAQPLIERSSGEAAGALAVSLAVVLIGLFLMISRRKAITQVVGLLVIENGIFMAAISLSFGMPLIVELGISFDVLVAVLIMGVLVFRINRTFDSLDTSFLRGLRD